MVGAPTLLAAASDDAAHARHRVLEVLAGLHDRLGELMPVAPAPGVLDRVRDFANNWQSVFAILFMVALVFVLWRTLRLMPQTKASPSGFLDAASDTIAQMLLGRSQNVGTTRSPKRASSCMAGIE